MSPDILGEILKLGFGESAPWLEGKTKFPLHIAFTHRAISTALSCKAESSPPPPTLEHAPWSGDLFSPSPGAVGGCWSRSDRVQILLVRGDV